jgi:hypothetical protein
MFYGVTICDGEGCGSGGAIVRRTVAFGTFDTPTETAGDALEVMRSGGWAVTDDGRTVCPACVERGVVLLPPGETMRRMLAIVKSPTASPA